MVYMLSSLINQQCKNIENLKQVQVYRFPTSHYEVRKSRSSFVRPLKDHAQNAL